jgi:hypothetical protein
MHTYHRLAVEAIDEDDAKGKALQFAEQQEWSDWHSLPDNDRLDGVSVATNYKANPTKFNELVNEALGWTQETIDKVIREYGDISLKELLTNPKYDMGGFSGSLKELTEEERDTHLRNSLAVFRVGRAMRVKNKEYDPETFFYDTHEHTPNPKYLEDRCVINPEEQWIVIVDYHF